jgi:hypothetical protein
MYSAFGHKVYIDLTRHPDPPFHYAPPHLPTHRHPRAREHHYRRSTHD